MPERLREEAKTLSRTVIAGGAVLAVLVVVIGYGNDYTSCARQGPVRDATNARAMRDRDNWMNAAKARTESARREVELSNQVSKSPIARPLKRFFASQAAADRKTAYAYRQYAAEVASDRVPSLNCGTILPGTR